MVAGSNFGILNWDQPLLPHTLWTTPNQHRAGSNRDIGKDERAQDDLRSRDPTSPALPGMNDEITRTTNEHKRQKWR